MQKPQPMLPSWPSLGPQMAKNLPAVQETRVQSLHWEDPLEKGMATHSSILAWRIPWTEEPGRLYSPWARSDSDKTEQLSSCWRAGLCCECCRWGVNKIESDRGGLMEMGCLVWEKDISHVLNGADKNPLS